MKTQWEGISSGSPGTAFTNELDGGQRQLRFNKYLLSIFHVPDLVQALGRMERDEAPYISTSVGQKAATWLRVQAGTSNGRPD